MKNAKALFIFSVLSVLLYCPEAAQAQDSRIGIKGGVNVSNFYSNEVGDQNIRTGFNVGLFTELAVSEYFSIQPEVLLSTKGNRTTYGENDGVLDFVGTEGEVQTNFTYIDIPVLAKVTLGEVLNIHAGPYASYLLGATTSTDGDLAEGSEELDRDNFNNWDFGVAAGVGLDFSAVTIGVRYNLGLVEIAESTAADALFGEAKNSVLQGYIAIGL